MNSQILKKESYILYLLNHLEPNRSDLYYLNKIAFLIEFAYKYFNNKDLSDAQYAAIDLGPVIDQYKDTLKKMQKSKLIKLDGYKVRLIDSKKIEIPEEIKRFTLPLIKKYSQMSLGELKILTHSMDSYQITTDGEKKENIGKIIDKDLAYLETSFFEENQDEEEEDDVDLPSVDFKKISRYEF